jgi:hypothetical protein
MSEEQNIPFRKKAEDGSYVTAEDIYRQEQMLLAFIGELNRYSRDKWSMEASLGKFDHADAEVYKADKFIGVAEAKFRDRFDKNNPWHCLQIGLDKIIGIWDKYAPDWRSTGKVVPIVLVSEVYKNVDEPALGTETYAFSLGHITPWLMKRVKQFERSPQRFVEDFKSTSRPHIRWVENKYSDKGHGHQCLWIPLEWCAPVKEGMDISSGIKAQSLQKRVDFTSRKFWESEVEEDIE